ncbi:MAG: hypothetical protein V1859_06490 [archaeon]
MKKNRLTDEDRYKIQEYFKNYATMQIHSSGYHFDEEAKHIRIGMIKKGELEYIKKDQIMLFIGTPRGLINLAVTNKQLRELKTEIDRYNAHKRSQNI